MTVEQRNLEPGTDVLIRKVDSHLAAVRAGLRGAELELAERLGRCLRELVVSTAHASAADRGQVRAAVHYFVLRRESRGRLLSVRSLAAAERVVRRVAEQLGRADLLAELPLDDRSGPESCGAGAGLVVDPGPVGRAVVR
ncbi:MULTISPECIES: hypothetical protein [Micromonospora]|uniref:hypothetical protein n=1 Tax=Micromonospora TaxID=1873 RepID=UPI00210366D8|nr:hypothetical protein [Micromonospora sp. WP24]